MTARVGRALYEVGGQSQGSWNGAVVAPPNLPSSMSGLLADENKADGVRRDRVAPRGRGGAAGPGTGRGRGDAASRDRRKEADRSATGAPLAPRQSSAGSLGSAPFSRPREGGLRGKPRPRPTSVYLPVPFANRPSEFYKYLEVTSLRNVLQNYWCAKSALGSLFVVVLLHTICC